MTHPRAVNTQNRSLSLFNPRHQDLNSNGLEFFYILHHDRVFIHGCMHCGRYYDGDTGADGRSQQSGHWSVIYCCRSLSDGVGSTRGDKH